uniref:Uncharacterized protein n=1 Tax=Chromera velia CCMP2878 TaxID=1169474 RepID=A0A0G4GS69_9ALVE|eukprot:Cvel_23149.t1-p1 / transcript=Cvel_23149.t1 / gene=Cvel_23149 / organism=Chromera_velia_CCMP2878 / gene_product=hypothetical protein / transcript_product=hypothetical protein / location=Cvel_scaffold2354:16137-19810(+) / protein_length=1097 / sequence_SO=supercontig / SO=protein_coding / is_pseudo=false
MQPQPNLESPSSPTMVQQQQQHQPPHRPPIAAGTPPLPPSSSHMQQQPQPIESPLLWQRGLGVSAARQALQVASASTYNPLMQQQQQQSQSGVPVPVAAPVAVPGGPAVSPATAPVSAQAVAAAAAAAAAAVVGVGGVGGMYSQEPVPGASHTPQISSPSIMLGSSQPPSAAASLGPPHYLSSPAPAWSSMMSDWIVPVTPGTSRQFGAGPRRSLTLQGLNRTGTGLTALGEGPSSSVTGASPLGQLLSVVSPPQFDHRYAGGAGHWTEKSLRMLEAAGLSELLRQPIDPGPAVPAGGRGAGGGEGTPTPRAVVTSGSASAASVQPAAAQNPTGTLLSAQQQQTFAAASFVPAVLFGHPSQFPQGTAAAAAAAAAAATASQLAPPSAAASGPQSSAAVASAVENVPLQQDDASASAAAAADAALNPVPPLSGSSSNAPEHAASQTGAAHAVPLSSEGQRREEEEEEEDHPTHSSADVRQKRGRGAEQQKSKQPSGSPVEASGGTDREGEGMGVGVGPPESRHIQAPHSTPEVVPETESTVRGGEGGEGDGKRSGNTGDSEKREKENVEKLSGSGTTDSRSLPRVGEKEKHGEESNEEVEVSTTTGCQGNSQSKGDAGAQSATGSGVGVGRRRSSLKALTGVGTSTRQMRKLLLGEACSVGSLSFDSRRESLARVEEKGGDSSSDLPPNSAAAAAQQQQNNTQQNNSPLDSGCLKKTNADDPPTSQSPNPSSSQHQHWQVQDEGMKAADSGDMPAEESKQKEEPEPGAASTPADVVPSAQQAVTLPSNQLAQGAAIHPLQVPFLVTPQPALSQSHVSVPSSAAASITPSAGSMQHQPMAVGATPLGSGSAAGSAAAASGPSVVPSTAAAAAASAATPFSSQQLAGPNNPLAGSTTSPGLHASFVSNGSAGQGQGVGVDGSVQQGGQTAAALSQMVPLASQRVAPLFVFTPTVTSMNAAERFGRRGLSRMPLEALFETPDGTAASAPSPSGSGGDVPVPAGSSASSGAPQPQPARAAVGDPSASQQALAALLQGVDVNSLLQAGGDVGHLMISPQPSRRRLVNMRDVRAGTATVHDLLQDAKSELIEKLAVLRNQEYTD